MKPFNTQLVLLTVAIALMAGGCKRRSKGSTENAALPPLETSRPTPAGSGVAASAYDAGTPAERQASERDRLYKRWVGAFVGGSSAAKAQAKEEIAKQPAEVQAGFRKFCDVNGVKLN